MRKITVAASIVSCAFLLSGCSSTYDVLDKVADTKTVGESISDKVEKEIKKESENVEYFFRSISNDLKEFGKRPEYDVSKYVDTSDCDIKKAKSYINEEIFDDDVEEEIKNIMKEKNIFDTHNISKQGDILTISYTVTEKGKSTPYFSGNSEDIEIGNNFFPDEVDKAFIGTKVGDSIIKEIKFPNDSLDVSYKGKTFLYNIKVESVKGMELTDAVAYQLSNGSSKTAKDYRKYAKKMLQVNNQTYQIESVINTLCDMCTIKSIPEDVLEYDIQNEVISLYESEGIDGSDEKALESYLKDNGYKSIDEYMIEVKSKKTDDLKEEMKLLALAEKYNVMPKDKTDQHSVSITAKENLKKEIESGW